MNTNYLKKSRKSESLRHTAHANYDNNDGNLGDDNNNDDDKNLIKPSGGFSKDSIIFKKSVVGDQIRKSIFRIKEVRRIQFTCDLILSDNGKIGGGLVVLSKDTCYILMRKSIVMNYYFIQDQKLLKECFQVLN